MTAAEHSPLEHRSVELHDLNYPKNSFCLTSQICDIKITCLGSGMSPPPKRMMYAACVHIFGVERYATSYLSASFLQNSGTNKGIHTYTHTHIYIYKINNQCGN